MVMTTKLVSIGDSTAVILTPQLLERLRVGPGDLLHVVETSEGVSLTPLDATLAAQMAVAERVMREDRDVLRKLAE